MSNCSRFRGLLVLLAGAAPVCGQVQVREDWQTLAAWEEAAPNPNPEFPQFFSGGFASYPYPIRRQVPKTSQPAPRRTVVIENEYLSCRILPDLGGQLQGCTDKISGKEILYFNPLILNGVSFPVVRARVAVGTIDFAYSVTDGVGRVVTESSDRTSGMEWREESVLRPGSTVLEQKVTLHNSSPGRRGYQWSSDAAVEMDDPHLRMIYPAKWMIPQGEWPLNGEAVSDTKATALFAHGSNEPWMALYKPGSRTGLVHYAEPGVVRGKRVRLGGPDAKYVEMEAALFETPQEYSFLQPGEVKTFSHSWIPLRNIGGVSRATPDLVLNIQRTGAAATVELYATHSIPGAKIRVLDGAKAVLETQADLDPKATWAKTLDAAPGVISVEVTNAAGSSLMRHREGDMDALPFDRNAKNPEPMEPPAASADPRTQTEAAYLARGEWHEQHDQFVLAWLDYRAGVAKVGDSENLALAAGRTAFILNRKADVLRLLAPISGRPHQTEAAYYYGTMLASQGVLKYEARNALSNAMRDPRFAGAARLQLATLNAREGNLPEAVRVIERTVAELAPGSASEPQAAAQVGAVEVAILRRAGQVELAKKKLEFWLGKDPANNMLRAEKMLLGGPEDGALWTHLASDPERMLRLADLYMAIDAYQDAIPLLERKYPAVPATEARPGVVLPQDHPLVAYYRGYCRLKAGQDPGADFAAAASLSTQYVFPGGLQTYDVLSEVVARSDRDANAHSLIADVYFAAGENDAAITEWRKALAINKNLPAVHRNLGRLLLEVKRDPAGARSVLQEGLRLYPEDGDIKDALARASAPSPVLDSKYWEAPMPVRTATPPPVTTRETPPASAPAPAAAPPASNPAASPVSGIPIPTDVASRALLGSALDPEVALGQFNATNFAKDKQPNEVRRAYIEVRLQRLLAKAHAGKCREAMGEIETLGDEDTALPFTLYGFGAFTRAAHFQYYLGVIENLCGDDKAAKKSWGRITKTANTFESPDDVFPYLALRSLGESGSQEKIAAAIQAVHAKAASGDRPELTFMEGALLIAAGKRAEGDALLQKAVRSNEVMVQFLSLVAIHENAINKAPLLR